MTTTTKRGTVTQCSLNKRKITLDTHTSGICYYCTTLTWGKVLHSAQHTSDGKPVIIFDGKRGFTLWDLEFWIDDYNLKELIAVVNGNPMVDMNVRTPYDKSEAPQSLIRPARTMPRPAEQIQSMLDKVTSNSGPASAPVKLSDKVIIHIA